MLSYGICLIHFTQHNFEEWIEAGADREGKKDKTG